VLQKLADHIKNCIDRASEAGRRASETTDPATKADYLQMEQRWFRLARSYEFVESLETFLLDSQKAKASCAGRGNPELASIDFSKQAEECLRLAGSTGPLGNEDKVALLQMAKLWVRVWENTKAITPR
jgi:hypothetical protein